MEKSPTKSLKQSPVKSSEKAVENVGSEAQKILSRFSELRSYQPFYSTYRSPDRDIYETQLRDVSGAEIKKEVVLGVALLIYFQIEPQGSAYDYLSLGSRLCAAIDQARFPITVASKTSDWPVKAIATEMKSPTQTELGAGGVVAIQEAFLSLHAKKGAFFTPNQTIRIYQESFLCALFDVHARAKAAQRLHGEAGDTTLQEMCTVLKNVVMNLSTIAEGVAVVFPEMAGDQYKPLRMKWGCFLVVNRVYFALEDLEEKSKFHFAQKFLREILQTFFAHRSLHGGFQYPAYSWARALLMSQEAVLFKDVSEATRSLCLQDVVWMLPTTKMDAIPLLQSIKEYHFGVTLKEERLLEHFFAHAEEANKLTVM